MSILGGSASSKTMLNLRGSAAICYHRARDSAIHLALAAIALSAVSSHGAEVIPPKPSAYFNDYAAVVSKEAALHFNEELAQFERETSNQILVAIFPKM